LILPSVSVQVSCGLQEFILFMYNDDVDDTSIYKAHNITRAEIVMIGICHVKMTH